MDGGMSVFRCKVTVSPTTTAFAVPGETIMEENSCGEGKSGGPEVEIGVTEAANVTTTTKVFEIVSGRGVQEYQLTRPARAGVGISANGAADADARARADSAGGADSDAKSSFCAVAVAVAHVSVEMVKLTESSTLWLTPAGGFTSPAEVHGFVVDSPQPM
jgi:hypothetical protein